MNVQRLRRWGVGWWSILKCFVGLHHGWVRDRELVCGRCGKVLVADDRRRPLGFHPMLPKTLRIAAEKLRVLTDSPNDWTDLDDLADRIEATLPPEDPT